MKHSTNNGIKIVAIKSVIDTRQYEERGDKWVPIPGSGELNQCARCGRNHEVHAYVELENGETALVGTGCMSHESLEVKKEAKSAARAAKKYKALRAELAHYERKVAEYNEMLRRVDVTIERPQAEIIDGNVVNGGVEYARYEIRIGDYSSFLYSKPQPEDIERAYAMWRREKAEELGANISHKMAERSAYHCSQEVERLREKYGF